MTNNVPYGNGTQNLYGELTATDQYKNPIYSTFQALMERYTSIEMACIWDFGLQLLLKSSPEPLKISWEIRSFVGVSSLSMLVTMQ